MAKTSGYIGYCFETETKPGVWEMQPIEKQFYGDLIRNSKKDRNGEGLNDDITINNQISFLADPYAREHFHQIKYVKFLGASWKVTDVTVEFPRLILNLGGVYNGESGRN